MGALRHNCALAALALLYSNTRRRISSGIQRMADGGKFLLQMTRGLVKPPHCRGIGILQQTDTQAP